MLVTLPGIAPYYSEKMAEITSTLTKFHSCSKILKPLHSGMHKSRAAGSPDD
jgi:hypothetical protein